MLKKNHSTGSTVNTHISLTLSKSQRNKTKRLVNKTASTGRTKHKIRGKCTSPDNQQLRGLGSSTLGGSVTRQKLWEHRFALKGEEQQERGELGEVRYLRPARMER